MPKQSRSQKSRRDKRVKDWERLPPLNRNAAGIDVGNAEHHVAVPMGRDAEPVQKFGSFTADLHRMAQWLKDCGIDTVVIQATGVYWVALYQILEALHQKYPSLLLLTDESWAAVRNTPGVTGFVGLSSKPSPLSLDEVALRVVDRARRCRRPIGRRGERERGESCDSRPAHQRRRRFAIRWGAAHR